MLTNEELITTKGGAKLTLIGGIIAGITFIIGVIDGYLRPLKCNK